MKSQHSLLAVAALVAAFAVGSAGTAVAGPALTKAAVKKIAAKVVDKAAPDLSVAHATSADTAKTATNATNATNAGNSDRLDNLDSSDLTTKALTFTVPAGQSAANSRLYLFTVPAGNWLVTYDVRADVSTATLTCAIQPNQNAPSTLVGHAFGATGATQTTAAGSAVITTPAGAAPALSCQATPNFNLNAGSVTFTRIDALTSGAGVLFGE